MSDESRDRAIARRHNAGESMRKIAGDVGLSPSRVQQIVAAQNGGSGARAANGEARLAVLSELVDRLQFARRHGMQYGEDRDLYAVGGYPKTLSSAHYLGLYERDGIAARIVDMPAETTWRMPPEVSDADGSEDDTEFTRDWTGLVERLGLWNRFERADRLSRLGRYSVILIGDGTDDRAMAQPMSTLRGPDAVLYVSVYHEQYAPIETWVTDPRDERFGLPLTYRVQLAGAMDGFRTTRGGASALVHWTRVIHVAGGLLSDDVMGRPALRDIFNDLHDFQKVRTSTAEAFWQRVAGILAAVVDPEAKLSDDQFPELDTALKELYHNLRRTFYGQGVELRRLAESEPNPGPAADLYMTLIAGATGIPKRMLFGSETGERASSEDQKTWLGTIAARQVQHAEPAILRPFIDRLVDHRALPRADYTVVWPPLFEEPEKDIAEANRTRAEAIKALTPIGGSPLDLAEIDTERNIWPRPTGERGELTPEELEPPEPEPVPLPGGPPDEGAEEPEMEDAA